MEPKRSRSIVGKVFLTLFITIITLIGISVGIYYGYKHISSLTQNNQNNQNSQKKEPDYWEESEHRKGMIKIFKDEDEVIHFNDKKIKGKQAINPDFQYGNLSIKENPFIFKYPDGKTEKFYFLGEEGITILNNMFIKRGIYGPEINALKNVYINFETQGSGNANGLYYTGKQEMYIFPKLFVENNAIQIKNTTVGKRVEMVFGTLMHEYAHHIDNIYNRSTKKNDIFANDDLVENELKDGHDHGGSSNGKRINNNKFINEFRANLNYHDINDSERYKYMRNKNDFEHSSNKIPVYKDISSNDLFRLVNLNISPYEKSQIESKLYDGKHYFTNNSRQKITYTAPVDKKSIDYLFSMAELFPRELIKLSLGPNGAFYDIRKPEENFLYFKTEIRNNGFKAHFSAIGDDALKTISFWKNTSDWNYINAYAPNWVFKNQIEHFVSQQINHLSGEYIKPFQGVGDKFHKGLFKAYIDLMGWGQLISFAHYNLNNSNSNEINLGGYFQLPKQKNIYKNKEVALIFVAKNDPTNFIKNNIVLQDYNFIAKKQWNSIYDGWSKKNEQANYWTEKWIYGNLFKEDSEYVSYIARNINSTELNNKFKNKQFDVKLWIDFNDDKKYDLNDSSEVFSLLNDNKYNNLGNNFLQKHNNDKRVISPYRHFGTKLLGQIYEKFELSKDIDGKYYYTLLEY
ncbi:MYPU_1760 family metalloprotease [Mycoplasma enhydrae]|uniref:MYPU_1760 family metalloprotease n=1 Tax=Mycoplasma enhydrae TaxID=2499220 RepID=UPI00197BF7E8|nr:hypothetical protein [Mycoplasma enhydrae]MBN4089355.1 hypothetical protein [Mycoplasma enhydrae]